MKSYKTFLILLTLIVINEAKYDYNFDVLYIIINFFLIIKTVKDLLLHFHQVYYPTLALNFVFNFLN